jgi:hypothetical protein
MIESNRFVVALDALLKLGVDVEGHLRVGMADSAHHPLQSKRLARSAIEI